MIMQQNFYQEPPGVLVIGLGNEFRSDDGAGLILARKLGEAALPGVSIVEESGDCTRLVEMFSLAPAVVIIDAMASGMTPGTMLKFDLLRDEIPARYFQHSLHAFGVLEAVRLSKNLGALPQDMKLFGIEGQCFQPGVGLTDPVARAVDAILPQIIRECARLADAHLPACNS